MLSFPRPFLLPMFFCFILCIVLWSHIAFPEVSRVAKLDTVNVDDTLSYPFRRRRRLTKRITARRFVPQELRCTRQGFDLSSSINRFSTAYSVHQRFRPYHHTSPHGGVFGVPGTTGIRKHKGMPKTHTSHSPSHKFIPWWLPSRSCLSTSFYRWVGVFLLLSLFSFSTVAEWINRSKWDEHSSAVSSIGELQYINHVEQYPSIRWEDSSNRWKGRWVRDHLYHDVDTTAFKQGMHHTNTPSYTLPSLRKSFSRSFLVTKTRQSFLSSPPGFGEFHSSVLSYSVTQQKIKGVHTCSLGTPSASGWVRNLTSDGDIEANPGPAVVIMERPATKEMLVASGYTVRMEMGQEDTIVLHRQRLFQQDRLSICSTTGADCIIGGDLLEESSLREPVLYKRSRRWPGTRPLVFLPAHLEKLKNKVRQELCYEEGALNAVTVVGNMDRRMGELLAAGDIDRWRATKEGWTYLEDWGDEAKVSNVHVFLQPLNLRRFPADCKTIPPPKWQSIQMNMDRCMVAVTVVRSSGDLTPIISSSGVGKRMDEVLAECRGSVVPFIIEIDTTQRKGGEAALVIKRGAKDLIKQACGRELPVMIRGVRSSTSMVSATIELPSDTAASIIRSSGAVRGVFARPYLGGIRPVACPRGFGDGLHKVVWVKVERFSDVVFNTLAGKVQHEGLVCGRSKGEVGVRVKAASDLMEVRNRIEETLGLEAKVKKVFPTRDRVRLRYVPTAKTQDLEDVFARISEEVKVISSRFLGGSRWEANMEAVVDNLPRDVNEWVVGGLGIGRRSIIIKRLAPRAMGRPETWKVEKGERISVKKPLNSEQKQTYAMALNRTLPAQDVEMVDAVQDNDEPPPRYTKAMHESDSTFSNQRQNKAAKQQHAKEYNPPPKPAPKSGTKKDNTLPQGVSQGNSKNSKPKDRQFDDRNSLESDVRRLTNQMAELLAELAILRKENMELKQQLAMRLPAMKRKAKADEDLERKAVEDVEDDEL
jgi:hypothetical protein